MNIGAVVLAAGASSRMGSPKALLKVGEETFVRHIVGVVYAAGVSDVVVVLGADAEEVRGALAWFDGTIIDNKDWRNGQLTSILAGLNAFRQSELDALLICPVDRPFVTPALILDLLGAFQKSRKPIIVPVFQRRRGHPVLFSHVVFDDLRVCPLDVGARQLLRNHPKDVLEVDTCEEGVVINIDTPEDYAKHKDRERKS